jgi:hypothetical protein
MRNRKDSDGSSIIAPTANASISKRMVHGFVLCKSSGRFPMLLAGAAIAPQNKTVPTMILQYLYFMEPLRNGILTD